MGDCGIDETFTMLLFRIRVGRESDPHLNRKDCRDWDTTTREYGLRLVARSFYRRQMLVSLQ